MAEEFLREIERETLAKSKYLQEKKLSELAKTKLEEEAKKEALAEQLERKKLIYKMTQPSLDSVKKLYPHSNYYPDITLKNMFGMLQNFKSAMETYITEELKDEAYETKLNNELNELDFKYPSIKKLKNLINTIEAGALSNYWKTYYLETLKQHSEYGAKLKQCKKDFDINSLVPALNRYYQLNKDLPYDSKYLIKIPIDVNEYNLKRLNRNSPKTSKRSAIYFTLQDEKSINNGNVLLHFVYSKNKLVRHFKSISVQPYIDVIADDSKLECNNRLYGSIILEQSKKKSNTFYRYAEFFIDLDQFIQLLNDAEKNNVTLKDLTKSNKFDEPMEIDYFEPNEEYTEDESEDNEFGDNWEPDNEGDESNNEDNELDNEY